jgi:type II secretory pathway pseudopilin PulG
MYNKTTKRRGFTLLEILAVISIVIVLLGLVIGLSSVVNEKAAESRAMADLEVLKKLVDDYRFEHGDYPADLGMLPTELNYDPWGNTYICNYAAYKGNDEVLQYIYGSRGRDNFTGTKGMDDDGNGIIDGTKKNNIHIPDLIELGFGDDITNIR